MTYFLLLQPKYSKYQPKKRNLKAPSSLPSAPPRGRVQVETGSANSRDASRVSAARPSSDSTGGIMQQLRHGAARPISGDARGSVNTGAHG